MVEKTTDLVVNDLNYSIGGKVLFQNLQLRLPAKETCLIVGPSGSGKTTLLSILAGLQKPDNGSVIYDGTSLYELNENQRDYFRGQHVGILFQNFHLINPLSVRQNILLASKLAGKAVDTAYVDTLLNNLDLSEKADQKAATLSVGESQRVALARAMVTKPKWLLCDEPTSSLDDTNAQNILTLIQQEAAKIGTALVIITHDHRVKQHITADCTLELGKE
jgi:putative ABC transport system ATP-binding protein